MNFVAHMSYIMLGILSTGPALTANETQNPPAIASSFAPINHLNFHSQASQDKFVYSLLYSMLGKQDTGYYLEIGAGEPININNSYFFEKNHQWHGISMDISENLADRWYPVRNNLLLTQDATTADYDAILTSFPDVIDYLSLDIDGFYASVLRRIPLHNHIFKVITIEHDFYRYGPVHRDEERKILISYGYHLLCANVSDNGSAFEDWWIHPSVFSPTQFLELSSLDLNNKDHNQILQTLQAVTNLNSP